MLSKEIGERLQETRLRQSKEKCVPLGYRDEPNSEDDSENNCSKFLAAQGNDREEKEKEACHTCQFFPTKNKAAAYSQTLYIVEDFILEQKAGLNPNPNELTLLEYEGVAEWYRIEQTRKDFIDDSLLETCQLIQHFLTKKG